jgi:hypothetical protein
MSTWRKVVPVVSVLAIAQLGCETHIRPFVNHYLPAEAQLPAAQPEAAQPRAEAAQPRAEHVQPVEADDDCTGDRHCLEPHQYFVCNTLFEECKVAQMLEKPDSNGKAMMLFDAEASTELTDDWVETRVADRTELRIGTTIVFPKLSAKKRRLHTTGRGARTDEWYFARITSLAPMASGRVRTTHKGEETLTDSVRIVTRTARERLSRR